uniref:Uncharacterized protein n=1 Tax=Physcomitrium patens TaxID=3218 RepID=A0A2K1KNL1_PHYPA|nr:hypothetical protein PHYPA_006265 [Physcomitrium patens]
MREATDSLLPSSGHTFSIGIHHSSDTNDHNLRSGSRVSRQTCAIPTKRTS